MTIYWTEERRSGGELLAAALEREGLHAPILRTAAGKPYLAGGPFVSVTHTEGLSAVAVSPRPVGIDAEAKREISAALIAPHGGREEGGLLPPLDGEGGLHQAARRQALPAPRPRLREECPLSSRRPPFPRPLLLRPRGAHPLHLHRGGRDARIPPARVSFADRHKNDCKSLNNLL